MSCSKSSKPLSRQWLIRAAKSPSALSNSPLKPRQVQSFVRNIAFQAYLAVFHRKATGKVFVYLRLPGCAKKQTYFAQRRPLLQFLDCVCSHSQNFLKAFPTVLGLSTAGCPREDRAQKRCNQQEKFLINSPFRCRHVVGVCRTYL